MVVPAVVDIGFDFRLYMLVATIVDCIASVRSPIERAVMIERATSYLMPVDWVIGIELDAYYQPQYHQKKLLYSLMVWHFAVPVNSYINMITKNVMLIVKTSTIKCK